MYPGHCILPARRNLHTVGDQIWGGVIQGLIQFIPAIWLNTLGFQTPNPNSQQPVLDLESSYTGTLHPPIAFCDAGVFGSKNLRKEGLRQLLDLENKGTAIPSDVRGVVYQLALLSGDQRAYHILKHRYLQVRLHASTAR